MQAIPAIWETNDRHKMTSRRVSTVNCLGGSIGCIGNTRSTAWELSILTFEIFLVRRTFPSWTSSANAQLSFHRPRQGGSVGFRAQERIVYVCNTGLLQSFSELLVVI